MEDHVTDSEVGVRSVELKQQRRKGQKKLKPLMSREEAEITWAIGKAIGIQSEETESRVLDAIQFGQDKPGRLRSARRRRTRAGKA